jgi:hypothetical protein
MTKLEIREIKAEPDSFYGDLLEFRIGEHSYKISKSAANDVRGDCNGLSAVGEITLVVSTYLEKESGQKIPLVEKRKIALALLNQSPKENKMKLTIKERTLIETLGKCYNSFLKLDSPHPNDAEEFAHHIHILQRQVMARLARREHPDTFQRQGRIE